MAMPDPSTANPGHLAGWSDQKTPPTSRMATHHPDPFTDSIDPSDQGLLSQSFSRSSMLDGSPSASMPSPSMPAIFTEQKRGIRDSPRHPGSASMAHQLPHQGADEDIGAGAQPFGWITHPHTRNSGLRHDPDSLRPVLSYQRQTLRRNVYVEATLRASTIFDAQDSASESFWLGEVNTLGRAETTTDTTTAVSEMIRQFLIWANNGRAPQGVAQTRHQEPQTSGFPRHIKTNDQVLGESLGGHERYLVHTSYLSSQPRTAIAF